MILPLYYKGMLLTKTQDQKIVIDYSSKNNYL